MAELLYRFRKQGVPGSPRHPQRQPGLLGDLRLGGGKCSPTSRLHGDHLLEPVEGHYHKQAGSLIKTGATPPSPVTPRYPHKLHFICFLFTVSLLIKSVIACLRGHGPHFPTQCDLTVCAHGCGIGVCVCAGICISVSCRYVCVVTDVCRDSPPGAGVTLRWQPEGLPSFSDRKTEAR